MELLEATGHHELVRVILEEVEEACGFWARLADVLLEATCLLEDGLLVSLLAILLDLSAANAAADVG